MTMSAEVNLAASLLPLTSLSITLGSFFESFYNFLLLLTCQEVITLIDLTANDERNDQNYAN